MRISSSKTELLAFVLCLAFVVPPPCTARRHCHLVCVPFCRVFAFVLVPRSLDSPQAATLLRTPADRNMPLSASNSDSDNRERSASDCIAQTKIG